MIDNSRIPHSSFRIPEAFGRVAQKKKVTKSPRKASPRGKQRHKVTSGKL